MTTGGFPEASCREDIPELSRTPVGRLVEAPQQNALTDHLQATEP
jgi:hypothetical protein